MQEVNLFGKLSLGGRVPNIIAKNITENGTYTPETGVDGFAPVNVNVPVPIDAQLSVTQNGAYVPGEGYRYNRVDVNVQPTLESKTITENGTYTPAQGYDGFGEVTVNVNGGVEVYTETYIGNGTRGHEITFQHAPKAILRISGEVNSSNITWSVGTITPECNRIRVNVGDSSQYTIQVSLSGDTMTLLQASYDAAANLNNTGTTYTVTYLA
jgi:hypothetical protein